MDQMEDKLGAILNNPQLMQQIMTMAQSLGQNPPEKETPPPTMPQFDPALLSGLGALAGQGKVDSNQQALLTALHPYLSSRKVEKLEAQLLEQGAKVTVYDLARCDMFAAVADAFRCSKLVLATTTYNGSVFPFMHEFIHHLTERNYSNRTVAFMENGSWAPLAAKVMKGMLEKSKNLTCAQTEVKILSALNEESAAQLTALAEELCGTNAQ